jgi:hypothetical protein
MPMSRAFAALRRTAAAILLIALSGAGAGCGSANRTPGPSAVPAPSPSAAGTRSGFVYRGMNHVAWWHDSYQQPSAAEARAALAGTGANWAGVLVTWYMDRRDSSALARDPQRTPSDAALSAAIRDLRARGLRVMLKPHVDVRDGSWRGQIQPVDAGAWFAGYEAFIAHYAALAQAERAELFDVGTELASMSEPRHAGAWAALITRVRSLYDGPLTYSANANNPADEFSRVAFWHLLDIAGLDVYVPLTNRAAPTSAELIQAWMRNLNGHDMVSAFRAWQATHGKPVIFTEIGYRSMAGANRAPWDWGVSGAADMTEQANCYEAAFSVWSREASWMLGVFWWAWPTTGPPPAGDTDYTPRGKPAEAVLRSWFAP